MDDVRWFASNAYSALVVPALRRGGMRIATAGAAPARVALAMSGLVAADAWRYARARRVPLVLYLWDLPPGATSRGRPDPVWWLGGRFVRLPRPGGFARRRGYYSRLCYMARRADGLWVPSEMTQAIVAARFGVTGQRVPYCYDSERFRPGSGPKASPPLLLSVSRLQPYKNHAAVLRAAARIGDGVQVRIIGRGPEAGPLQSLAAGLGVRARVDTTADDAAVVRAYHEAGVVICPSRFEGFGLTPIEAIACATPVVASDIPPHREFVGRGARLVPLDDEPALADAITAALAGPPSDPGVVADLTIEAAAGRITSALGLLLR